jgi:acetyl esterase/lipase
MPRPPDERPGRAAPDWLAARRRQMAGALEAGVWRTDPPARTEVLGGVRVLRFAPPGERRGVVLHLHGGGYRMGVPEMTGPYAAALAARCGVEVVCPAYRLAPEHPYPAGLNDAWSVWSALRAAGEGPVVVSGDSAGGGLAAALTSLCVADGAAPAGLVLLSAWLDLTVEAAAYQANAATDPLFSQASAAEAAELYLQGTSPRDPLASPLFAPKAGFPPTFVSVGAGEVLADDARGFHAALREAGSTAELLVVPDMEHTAVARSLELPGATETFAAVAAFIDAAVRRRSS